MLIISTIDGTWETFDCVCVIILSVSNELLGG